MNWKTDLKLADLDAAARIEITCRRCGFTRYEQKDRLMKLPEMSTLTSIKLSNICIVLTGFAKGACVSG